MGERYTLEVVRPVTNWDEEAWQTMQRLTKELGSIMLQPEPRAVLMGGDQLARAMARLGMVRRRQESVVLDHEAALDLRDYLEARLPPRSHDTLEVRLWPAVVHAHRGRRRVLLAGQSRFVTREVGQVQAHATTFLQTLTKRYEEVPDNGHYGRVALAESVIPEGEYELRQLAQDMRLEKDLLPEKLVLDRPEIDLIALDD